ncbi:MAG: GMP/IMP nucleotidase [Gammaproteobacteria bacterium]|nr:GMP/IMP nucleotidase [Gammaproteobacteria bacterium]
MTGRELLEVPWSRIDTVLLDMDGTLLDLHFDNHFWLEYVPQRYAVARGISEAAARKELMARYQDIQGTLDWYCVDHWTRQLGLDIALLKEEVDHLIGVHPHVTDFLDLLQRAGKRRVLVTNAHQKSLDLKMRRTLLRNRLDDVVCAHDLGLPKEDPGFWSRLQQQIAFDPARTLFVDDSLAVLRSAHSYGIEHLLTILLPDSRQAERRVEEFPAVRSFEAVLPGLRESI